MNELAALVCAVLLAVFPPAWGDTRANAESVCIDVATEAILQSVPPETPVPPALAVALSYRESGLTRTKVSRTGAVGPLQVKLNLHCPDDPECDRVATGVRVLQFFLRNRPPIRRAVGGFTGVTVTGNTSHVDNIVELYEWLQSQVDCMCSTGEPPSRRHP